MANTSIASSVKSETLIKAAYSAPGLKNPPTRYPKIAQMRQWEGIVTLEVRVLADGSAGEVKIVNSSGHDILDESAVEQVKSWHFIPAHRGGKSVEDWVRVPISFKFKR
jgi:protein TonB